MKRLGCQRKHAAGGSDHAGGGDGLHRGQCQIGAFRVVDHLGRENSARRLLAADENPARLCDEAKIRLSDDGYEATKHEMSIASLSQPPLPLCQWRCLPPPAGKHALRQASHHPASAIFTSNGSYGSNVARTTSTAVSGQLKAACSGHAGGPCSAVLQTVALSSHFDGVDGAE